MSDDGWGDESAGTFSGVGDAAPARGGGARGGGGAAGACFKCGETGHMSRECTKGEYLASPPPQCFGSGSVSPTLIRIHTG